MRLEYRFTFNDLLLLSASRLLHSLAFVCGQAFVSALIAFMIVFTVLWQFLLLSFLLFMVVLAVAALLLALFLSRKQSLMQSRSLRIDQHGLIESHGASETLLEWKNIRKTQSGIGVLNIHYGASGRVLTVPARVFRTRDEMRFFYHTIMQNSHAARV